MAIEVVGLPLVTINRGDTFILSEADGCITPYTDQGIYSRDTRYVSSYEIFADGENWTLQIPVRLPIMRRVRTSPIRKS